MLRAARVFSRARPHPTASRLCYDRARAGRNEAQPVTDRMITPSSRVAPSPLTGRSVLVITKRTEPVEGRNGRSASASTTLSTTTSPGRRLSWRTSFRRSAEERAPPVGSLTPTRAATEARPEIVEAVDWPSTQDTSHQFHSAAPTNRCRCKLAFPYPSTANDADCLGTIGGLESTKQNVKFRAILRVRGSSGNAARDNLVSSCGRWGFWLIRRDRDSGPIAGDNRSTRARRRLPSPVFPPSKHGSYLLRRYDDRRRRGLTSALCQYARQAQSRQQGALPELGGRWWLQSSAIDSEPTTNFLVGVQLRYWW